jgi:beta-glucanase (GH16 family)
MNQDECRVSRTHGWPGELQLFFDENVQLSGNGVLKLTARSGPLRDWYGASSVYSSGMIHSRFQFGKGRFEGRIKVPRSTSTYLWPAFWLFGGGSRCSELDVLEVLWRESDTYHAALHRYNSICDGSVADDNYRIELGELSDDFHVYRVDWDTWFVNFYLDDQLIYRACRIYDLLARAVPQCHVDAGVYIQNQAFPAQDAYVSIIAGLGLHKSYLVEANGTGLSIPDLPATMEVDWIRVYKRE